jgi:radical SAM superfamily enzyme
MQFTASTLAASVVDGVKIHCLYVVRGTRLEAQLLAGEYRCLEREEYADLVVDVIERLPARVVIQRLTGDPHAEELVAPHWCRNKTSTFAAILEALEHRDTWQGRLCGDDRSAPSNAS